MTFIQDPPRLGNQYDDDNLLQEHLERTLPPEMLSEIRDELRELGELGGGRLFEMQLADRLNEPVLTNWDPWGNRIDEIEVSPLWKEAERLTAERGLVAVAYERKHGEHSRAHQFALNYLVQASMDVYSCPLAMTDGAARTLLDLKNAALVERALPHLTSRDPATFWTSGQWMTERTGGSDVGLSETVARKDGDTWRLYGNKWFTSAATSQMALTLGRPEGNGPGGKGLALFYLETRNADGKLANILIHRLKDKLGTRKVPTAELDLEGTPAIPVAELGNGVRNITSMLNITRVWNAAGAIWGMRRAIALARDYARRRVQFKAKLSEKPLHLDALASMQAELDGAFQLTFRVLHLLGRKEAGEATDNDKQLLRIITPLAKLTTGKQAVVVASEALECIGGSGYVEDTGLPLLLRDAQVLPIWEGTTNVLSLDTLRAMSKPGTYEALQAEVRRGLAAAKDPGLEPCVQTARDAMDHAAAWIESNMANGDEMERGGRRLALTFGRTLELALCIEHAQWCLDNGKGRRALAAARRLAAHGVDRIDTGLTPVEADDSTLLALG